MIHFPRKVTWIDYLCFVSLHNTAQHNSHNSQGQPGHYWLYAQLQGARRIQPKTIDVTCKVGSSGARLLISPEENSSFDIIFPFFSSQNTFQRTINQPMVTLPSKPSTFPRSSCVLERLGFLILWHSFFPLHVFWACGSFSIDYNRLLFHCFR